LLRRRLEERGERFPVLGFQDVVIDGVCDFRALHALLELHAGDSRVLAQPPVVRLVSGQARAVDAALLAGADADYLPVSGVAHRVTLGVLQSDGCEDQVPHRRLGQLKRARSNFSYHKYHSSDSL